MRQETEVHFLFGTVILGLLSIFKKSQALSRYQAFNSVCLSRGHRDVRPPVQKRCASFPQASQEEFSLSSRDVRGTVSFLSEVEWTPRGPDSKEGPISLQWLKFRLVFLLTR